MASYESAFLAAMAEYGEVTNMNQLHIFSEPSSDDIFRYEATASKFSAIALVDVGSLKAGNAMFTEYSSASDDFIRGTTQSSSPTPAPAPAQAAVPSGGRYQQILDDYTARLKRDCPRLSMMECAEISNEGVTKMAEYMHSARGTDGQYATYEQWAQRLMDVYMQEAR
jgi:hypothetical protein